MSGQTAKGRDGKGKDMWDKTSPIGIIDSGIGGFSVARQIQKFLPNEDLIYFGDSANVPYGNRTSDKILSLTRYMIRFMERRQVKALLMACNTIACLIDRYRDDMNCPAFSVVQAGADAVKELDLDRVGVLSTCFTANSRCYPDLIEKQSPKTQVFSYGSPDLANVVERHLCDPEGREIIDDSIRANMGRLLAMADIRNCVLGCTHFSLLEERFRRLFPEVALIDPAEQMAKTVRAYLERNGLANPSRSAGTVNIFTTGDADACRVDAERAGISPISSVQFYPPVNA